MSSLEETLHLLKNYLSSICCCSRTKHKRFSNPEPVPMEGISSSVITLDSDFQDNFIEETLNFPFKGPSKLKLEDSGFSEDSEVTERSSKVIFRNDREDTNSTRESGYGRSIEDSLTSTPDLNFKIIEVKPKQKFKIELQDAAHCWFVFRMSLEFTYLQEFLKKRVGPVGPELRLDDGIKVQDINEFIRLILQDKELSDMTIVKEFFHIYRYESSSSMESEISKPQKSNSTDLSEIKIPQRMIHKYSAPLPPNPIRRPRSHRVPNKDSLKEPRCPKISEDPNGREEKQICPNDFEFLCVIGKGSFGKVMMARRKENDKIYAIKVLSKRMILRKNETTHVLSERSVLIEALHHPYLVQLHFAFTSPSKIFFVLDYVNGGELFYHLQRERTFTELRAKFYSAEICCALTYIHSKGILYRDLKPENILLDRDGHIVLTDFGLCKEGLEFQTSKTTTFCGTPEYLAPEVILKQPYTRSVDWWTFGAVLHEMIYGLPPFYSKNINVMYNAIIRKDLQLKHSASTKARNLMKQLLQKDPSKRLGSGPGDGSEVKSHEFFSKIDWQQMENRKIAPPFVPRVSGDDDLSNIDPSFTREPVGSCSSDSSRRPSATYEYDVFQGFEYAHPDEDDNEER